MFSVAVATTSGFLFTGASSEIPAATAARCIASAENCDDEDGCGAAGVSVPTISSCVWAEVTAAGVDVLSFCAPASVFVASSKREKSRKGLHALMEVILQARAVTHKRFFQNKTINFSYFYEDYQTTMKSLLRTQTSLTPHALSMKSCSPFIATMTLPGISCDTERRQESRT